MKEQSTAIFDLPITERAPRRMLQASPARRAISTLFLVDGMVFGTWAALIPSFQEKHSLSDGQLGWVLCGLIAGALIAMLLAGQWIARLGSRRIAFPAVLGFCIALPLLAFSPNYAALIGAATLFGFFKGAVDVSINAQAITVERSIDRPVMSSFQGFWSVGGLGAALLSGLALNAGYPVTLLMVAMAAMLFVLALSTSGGLLPDARSSAAVERSFSLPDSGLLRLGSLAFLALFSEGVLLDWSAVYARNVANVSVAAASVAFAAFATCMAGGRFFGDLLVGRFGPAAILRGSGVLMAFGVAIAVLMPLWQAVLAGFAIVGLGVSNLVPILFGAAGRAHPNGPGPGIAAVSTLGNLGFLCGPPVIGALAAFAGLSAAFGVVIFFGVIIATLGVSMAGAALCSK